MDFRPTKAARAVMLALSAAALTLGAMPATAADTYDYNSVCPSPNGGKQLLDKWRFWQCECTSYVADKLNERGVPFTWSYKSGSWGWAYNWAPAALKAGIPYDKSPRRGDVAWWGKVSFAPYGHVAYVDAVDAYGNVTISEYNWGTRWDYHTRTIAKGSTYYPMYFIHF